MTGDGTTAGIQGHVIYLVMLNGQPCAWAGDRDSANRIATSLRLKEDERNRKYTQYGMYIPPLHYSVCGVTDSPYGDPDADTQDRAESRLLKTLNKLELLCEKIRTTGGYSTQLSILKDLEALL